jgi:EAL domain-containing protein (putative c-di-GMP-specific phosphodiesterase class I)
LQDLATTHVRRDRIGIRARVRLLVAISGLVSLGVVALVAVLLARGADGMLASGADERARHGVELLVRIGPFVPRLSAANLANLTADDLADLDRATAQGQHDGLLAALFLFDASGRRVYPKVAADWSLPIIEPEVVEALRGHETVHRHPTEIDPVSGRPTGVIDAFEPLRAPDGTIFGAMETALRLEPILAESARIQKRIVLFLLGGAVLLWLLLMPLTIRAARTAATAWMPGRRRQLRAFERALDNDDIELVYQPQVAFDGMTVAVEALVRWRRDGRLLSPDAFLPLVESSKLVDALTDRVLHLAIAQTAEWLTTGHPVRVSVNLSARDLVDTALPSRICRILAAHQVPPASLTIEITETAIIEHPGSARAIVHGLSDAGISVSLDDFGVGHTSIARLHDLHAQEVKIDKSFISPADERTRSYAGAMIQFGRSLGLRVVAEGIEDEETLSFVRRAGADLAQGYYLSRPLAPGDVTSWLATARSATGSDDLPHPAPTTARPLDRAA